MGFDDLEAAAEEQEQDTQDTEPERFDPSPEPESVEEPEVTKEDTEPEMTETTTESTSEYSKGDWKDSPAFPYSAATQQAIYPREAVWKDLENTLKYDVERQLAEEGHEKIEKRELHDALSRVAMDHVDEIVDRVKEERKSR